MKFKENEEATAALGGLTRLARCMLQRLEAPRNSAPIAFIVGAGASMSAGLPSGPQLKNNLRTRFQADHDVPRRLLDREIAAAFGPREFEDLDLFEFASVLSRFALGRDAISDEMHETLGSTTHRPIAYELIAHLAKHRFLDNIISLNFDELLDHAILDEGRVSIVRGDSEVPRTSQEEQAYLVKPFGSLSASDFRLSTEDVANLGSERMSQFVASCLRGHRDRTDGLRPVIVLIGYRATENGFRKVVESLTTPPEFYLIDKDPLFHTEFRSRSWVADAVSIRFPSDESLDLLLEELARLWPRSRSWVPPARHRILGRCSSSVIQPPTDDGQAHDRFALELILQGVKSRGFIHVESFGRVPRLGRYATPFSGNQVDELLNQSAVLIADRWLEPQFEVDPTRHFAPAYILKKRPKALAQWMIQRFGISNDNGRMPAIEWELDGGIVRSRKRKLRKFIACQLRAVGRAPDIEIGGDPTHASGWSLGPSAEGLRSVHELIERSETALTKIKARGGQLRGIWSTGEWIFHPDGWAGRIGEELLLRDDVTIKVLITDPGGEQGPRAERRDMVLRNFSGRLGRKALATTTVRFLDWWDLNRILTIYEPAGEPIEATYFRRRLNQPVVQPFWVKGGERDTRALPYLEDVWAWYWARAMRDPTPERERIDMDRFLEQRGRVS